MFPDVTDGGGRNITSMVFLSKVQSKPNYEETSDELLLRDILQKQLMYTLKYFQGQEKNN